MWLARLHETREKIPRREGDPLTLARPLPLVSVAPPAQLPAAPASADPAPAQDAQHVCYMRGFTSDKEQ
eukprot:7649999-Pyramimonas_sp.AAC.1